MNRRTMVMKYVVCIIILLLVGTAMTQSIDANIGEESEHRNSKTHPIKTYYTLSNETKRDGIFERSFSLSPPEIKRIGKNIEIQTHEETSKILQPNKPVLPVVTRVFLFPFKTKIKEVTVNFFGKKEVVLSSPLSISSEKSPITSIKMNSNRATKKFIDSIVYPEKQYNYHMNAGRYGNNIVNYLSINLFPVQYDSLNMVIKYWDKANISISYEVPEKLTILDNKYDLIIIAPLMFFQEIKPLVEHKNAHGIKTKIVTLNEIYLGLHFPVEGRDKAEKIKYFLKHAFDEWGIKYVLFTGGRKGGLFNPWWWVPVRYSNIVDFIEYSYLSDLYFADLYDAEGNFSTWDSNENDIFAEWNKNGKDIIDMYPEISVGRLPCKNKEEVTIMVNKIITYENTAYGEKWFKKFLGVAGDTFPEDDSYYEGELSTEAAYGYLDGFEATYLWTSTGNFTGKQDVLTEVNEGCGLMLFSGHSDPHEWSNHPPNKNSWIDAPNSFEMDEYQNKEKLPIVIVSGCWISKFDTGLMNMLKGIITERLEYFRAGPFPTGIYTYDWIPNCWSWSMCSQTEGGCIAIIGGTGLGYGIKGKNCLNGGIIFLELQFFKSYGEGRDILGETHIMQLIYYMNEYPPMEGKTDCKHIQEFALLGDPSLKIGGYP